jgi:hypothetical protein
MFPQGLGIVRAGLLLQNRSVHPIESYLAKLAEIRASGHVLLSSD